MLKRDKKWREVSFTTPKNPIQAKWDSRNRMEPDLKMLVSINGFIFCTRI